MKTKFLFCILTAAVIAISSFLGCIPATSQEISEGHEFWFGLPYPKTPFENNSERYYGAREYPYYLEILSRKDNYITIFENASGLSKSIKMSANELAEFPLESTYINKESEIVHDYGYYIKAEEPVTVYLFCSYHLTGEVMSILPVEALGKEYHTLNLYKDSVEYVKPPQILITATEDNTELTYKTTANSVLCPAGESRSKYLMKGQTLLILGELTETQVQDWATDLTGTYIKANKPISVISGHTKGAFPYNMVGANTEWIQPYWIYIRNMLTESMFPIEYAGTGYLSIPVKYKTRDPGMLYMEDSFGDLIRFVAIEDNTIIYQLSSDGTHYYSISRVLKKGEWQNVTNQENVAYYRSNKPVLAGQYGKSYWISTGNEDHYPCGTGMQMNLIPIDRWINKINFFTVEKDPTRENFENFVCFTFNYNDKDNIFLDGKKISNGNSIQKVIGTDYAYSILEAVSGAHFAEGSNGAKFACYFYGHIDNDEDAFAYGSQSMFNFAKFCTDTLLMQDTTDCGRVSGSVAAVDLDSTQDCAELFSQSCSGTTMYNYTYVPNPKWKRGDTTFTFELQLIDPHDSAYATVEIMSHSGRTLTKTYKYYPEEISVDTTFLDFGLVQLNQKVCKTVTISNPTNINVTVSALRLKNGSDQFAITSIDLPLTLLPGQSQQIEVCALATTSSALPVRDSLIADLSCYPVPVAGLELRTGEPDLWISDADWGMVAINTEKPHTVTIENRGTIDAEIYDINWNDKTHFTHIDGLFTSPGVTTVLKPNESLTFTAFYKPDTPNNTDRDSAFFSTNATKTKLYSIWQGSAADAGPLLTGYDWKKVRMIDDWQKSQTPPILQYKGQIELGCSGNAELNVRDVTIEGDTYNVLSIDKTQMPQKLTEGNPVFMDVYFTPNDEMEYTATVKLTAEYNGDVKYATATLHGIGIEPHINVVGYDFTPAILIGTSTIYQNCQVQHRQKSDLTAMQLTLISSLTIEGTDKDAFEIDPNWISTNSFPIIIPIGQIKEIPVRFTPTKSGLHTAQLIAHSDAPNEDNNIGNLTGMGYNLSIDATDYNFPTIFIHTTLDNGIVSLINTGSGDVTINRDINQSLMGADIMNFNIKDIWLSSNTQYPIPYTQITLKPNDTLNVQISFTPDKERTYNAYIEYETSIGTEYSYLTGGGMVLRTIAEIPKYWSDQHIELIPGQKKVLDFKFYKSYNETKEILEGDITTFIARVKFNQEGGTIDVLPDAATTADIITEGTMTEGWNVDYVKLITNNTLEVKMSSDQALLPSAGLGNDLFKFRMNTFLSSKTDKPLILSCELQLTDRPYIFIDTIPGDIKIKPVCVNLIRLVGISSIPYTMSEPKPNPASSSSTLDYSIAFEGKTTFELYDSFGNRLASVFNENLSAGSYSLSLNTDALHLSSGTYFIRMESGAYSETRKVVVVK